MRLAAQLFGNLAALHNQLVEAYRKHCPHGWPTGPNDGYFLQNLWHHLAEAGMDNDLVSLLLGLRWIEAKAANGLVFDLQRDYARTASLSRIGADKRRQLGEFEDFVRRQSHILAAYPALTFQQAANQPDASAPAVTAKALWDTGSETRPWLQWVNKSQHRDPCLMTLQGHTYSVQACAYSPDGRHIVSGSFDRTLKVWDAETGRELRTLAGHTNEVQACAYSPDGRYIVSGSLDHTLKVWDAKTEQEIATFFAKEFTGHAVQGRAGRSIAAGTWFERVDLLHLVGFEIAAPIVTPIHLYRFDSRKWDSQPTAKCEWCGQRFVPIAVVLDTIASITRTSNLSPDQPHCLALPAEAWDEPRLLCECPHCHEPLKFNPFIVDNRG